ncbi:MAG: DVUA0089 family protein [Myxococcota bacterium]
MKNFRQLGGLLAVALLSAGALGTACSSSTPPDTKKAAKILSFGASKLAVASGDKVTLSWTTENATSVKIVATPGGNLLDGSSMVNGSIDSAALTAATTFVLTATGEGGDAMSSVMVTINSAGDVMVTTFTATPETIAPGSSSTLAWVTANATSVKVDEMNGGNIVPEGNMLSGSTTVMPTTTKTYVITAKGSSGTATQMVTVTVEGTPVITTFSAAPQMIQLGQTSTLSWTVTNAAHVTITDDTATMVYDGTNLTGTVNVQPTQNRTYTLTARSTLNQTVMSNPVMVTVNRGAVINRFAANPTAIPFGGTAGLEWDVSRATSIDILTGGNSIHTDTAATGSFMVSATQTTDYVLIAHSADGDSMAMVTLTVSNDLPVISSFAFDHPTTRVGGQVVLSWSVVGAATIVVSDPSGTQLSSSGNATGSVQVTATSSGTYTLNATNPSGSTMGSATLNVLRDPVIDSLDVNPLTYTQSSTDVRLTWATSQASSTELTIDGTAAAGFSGTATGTYSFNTNGSPALVFTARNAAATSVRNIRVVHLATPVDPGNTSTTAVALAGDGTGVSASIQPAGDHDWYTIVVPANGNVFAEISDGRGGCSGDTLLDLVGPDGTTVLGTDDDDGFGNCSQIEPKRDAFAANLPAGTYFLHVRAFNSSSTFDYVLLATASPAACANGIVESGAAEQCDDGNTTAGDGCDAICHAEVMTTITGPGVHQDVAGSIVHIGESDFIQIVMQAPGYIGAEVFMPSVGRCDAASGSSDTVLTLLDASFVAIGSDDNDGLNSCSKIDPTVDAFAAVPAGTYYLRVSEGGNDATIGSYVVQVRTIGQGCPNGILETGEECDDGNMRSGDGCSALCTFEGLTEVEPNDTFAAGTLTATAAGTFIVRGSLGANDTDFFRFDVPAGYHVDAYATLGSLDSCPETPELAVTLFSGSGSNLVTDTSNGPQGNCGRVWPYSTSSARAVTGGRYGIRITSGTPATAAGNYFLHLRVIAPGCGNTIIEGTEQCEDGNTVSGDGCSSTCTFEAVQTLTLSGASSATISGAIDPEFNRDAVALVVTSTVHLIAATYVDAASHSCPSPVDTLLHLFDSNGTQLGSDDDSGPGGCSLMDASSGSFTTLAPGNYWLVVDSYRNRSKVPNYDLAIRTLAYNVCGNGIVEGTEQCDGGSYCDAQCHFIIVGTVNGPTGTQTFTESLADGNARDYFRVVASADGYVFVDTGAPTLGTCPTDYTNVELINEATGDVIVSEFANGIDGCGRISGGSSPLPRVSAGNYLVRVDGAGAGVTAYQVKIDVVAADICGNTVTEAGETCDDGNTTSGDGCSATCASEIPLISEIEPNDSPAAAQSLNPIPTRLTVTGALTPDTDRDFFTFTLASAATVDMLTYETANQQAAGCNQGGDTQVWIYNGVPTDLDTQLASGEPTIVAFDDDSGGAYCSTLSGIQLAAGTYYIQVRYYENVGSQPLYYLDIAFH